MKTVLYLEEGTSNEAALDNSSAKHFNPDKRTSTRLCLLPILLPFIFHAYVATQARLASPSSIRETMFRYA
jgi:hypothetical protein